MKSRLTRALVLTDRIIFFIYLFLVPFCFCDFFPSLSNYVYTLPFYVSLVGIPIAFLRYLFVDKKYNRFLWLIVLGFAFCFGISTINAVNMSKTFDGYYGLYPFKLHLSNALQMAYAVISILYCIVSISKHGRNRHCKLIFAISCSLIIALGLLQLLVMKNAMVGLYDLIAKTKLVRPSTFIIRTGRVSLACPEPAWATALILMYFLPFCGCIFITAKSHKVAWRIWAGSAMALLLVEAIATKSSEMYATIAFIILVIVAYIAYRFVTKKNYLAILYLFLGLVLALCLVFVIPTLRDLLIVKLFSGSNWSTGTRMSYVYNALLTFLRHPFFGTGNGLQVFYYPKNIIDTWMASSPEVRQMITGEISLPYFAPTVFYLLSGYGLIGSAILVLPIFKFAKRTLASLNPNKKVRYVFYLTLLAYLFTSFFVESIIANLYIPVAFCLPYFFETQRKTRFEEQSEHTLGVCVTSYKKSKEELLAMANAMNLQTDCIIRNQGHEAFDETIEIQGHQVRLIGVQGERGVSKNRNALLELCPWDYLIFADDDLVMSDKYPSVLIEAFRHYEEADAVKCTVNLQNRKAHNNRRHLLRTYADFMDCTDIGPLAYCFRASFLKNNKIRFDELIGPGTDSIAASEDVLFYKDVFSNGGEIRLLNYELCSCANNESTWYRGFTEEYVFTVGGAYYLTYRLLYPAFYARFFLRFRKPIRSMAGGARRVLKILLAGRAEGIRFIRGRTNYKRFCQFKNYEINI